MPISPPQEALQRVSETAGELTLAASAKRVVSLAEAITGLKTHVDEGYTAKERPFCRTGWDNAKSGGIEKRLSRFGPSVCFHAFRVRKSSVLFYVRIYSHFKAP